VVLITGGMGFIGLHTARRFLDAGSDVVLTRFRALREPDFLKAELGGRARVESLDLTDREALLDVLRRHRVIDIVHLASPELGTEPAEAYRTSLNSLVNVLEAAHREGVRRLILASSVAVYSNTGTGPWREDMRLPAESDGYTAAAKKAMEVLALHFADRTGLDVVAVRLGATYGPLYHSMANLPSRLCHAAARGAAPDLEGTSAPPHAEAANDLCYVDDCARGIQLVQAAPSLRHRIYNVGGGRAVTNAELAAAVSRAAPGFRVSLLSTPAPPARGSYMDLARIREDAGYQPTFDVAAGVRTYVEWLRDHLQ
jgi:UDP-glucose 4-epimerase